MILVAMAGKVSPFLEAFTSIVNGDSSNETIKENFEENENRIFEGVGVAGSALVIGGILIWRKEKKTKQQNQPKPK